MTDDRTLAIRALGYEVLTRDAEIKRLRAWLRLMVDATDKVDEPCGWCIELRGWAAQALEGEPAPARSSPPGDHAR